MRKGGKKDSSRKGEYTMMWVVCVLILQPFLTACNSFLSHKKKTSQNPPPGCHFEAMGLSLLCYFQGSSTTLTIIRLAFNAITVIFDKYNVFALPGWRADLKICRGTMKVILKLFSLKEWKLCCFLLSFWKQKWQVYARLDCIVNTEVEENSWGFPLKLGIDR